SLQLSCAILQTRCASLQVYCATQLRPDGPSSCEPRTEGTLVSTLFAYRTISGFVGRPRRSPKRRQGAGLRLRLPEPGPLVSRCVGWTDERPVARTPRPLRPVRSFEAIASAPR